ncbi:MAG: DUF302 domain-containing protein [Gammaproteobacteria bacterium]|nr:DUF302 domain-containing protein [Gammaproteobacteria bacterium]
MSNTILRVVFTFAILIMLLPNARADDGLVNLRSQFDVAQTLDRFEAAAKAAGLKVFTRIDHAKGAASVGKSLRPTELLIFGSPKVGTGVISSNQRAAIDLPLKVLAWQDTEGVVWLSYLRPAVMFSRYAIGDRPNIKKQMSGALAKLAKTATQP